MKLEHCSLQVRQPLRNTYKSYFHNNNKSLQVILFDSEFRKMLVKPFGISVGHFLFRRNYRLNFLVNFLLNFRIKNHVENYALHKSTRCVTPSLQQIQKRYLEIFHCSIIPIIFRNIAIGNDSNFSSFPSDRKSFLDPSASEANTHE
jgi:hypothetical protein